MRWDCWRGMPKCRRALCRFPSLASTFFNAVGYNADNLPLKFLQISRHPKVVQPAPQMEGRVAIIDPEAVDLDAGAKGETRQAAEVVDGQFLAHKVVVAEAQAEVVLFAEEEFPVEDEVAEEVVEPDATSAAFGIHLAEEEGGGLGVGVVVEDIPAVEMAVDDGKTKGEVTQAFGDAQLYLERQRLRVAVLIGRQLRTDTAEYDGGGEVAGGVEVHPRQVSCQTERGVAL